VPIADSITDLVGRTPLVRLGRIDAGTNASRGTVSIDSIMARSVTSLVRT